MEQSTRRMYLYICVYVVCAYVVCAYVVCGYVCDVMWMSEGVDHGNMIIFLFHIQFFEQ